MLFRNDMAAFDDTKRFEEDDGTVMVIETHFAVRLPAGQRL